MTRHILIHIGEKPYKYEYCTCVGTYETKYPRMDQVKFEEYSL